MPTAPRYPEEEIKQEKVALIKSSAGRNKGHQVEKPRVGA
jgi:hypothetical protein